MSSSNSSSGGSGSGCPCSYCYEVCINPIVSFLLCTEEQESTRCLSPATLVLTLQGGIALLVLLAAGTIMLMVTVCGLTYKIWTLKRLNIIGGLLGTLVALSLVLSCLLCCLVCFVIRQIKKRKHDIPVQRNESYQLHNFDENTAMVEDAAKKSKSTEDINESTKEVSITKKPPEIVGETVGYSHPQHSSIAKEPLPEPSSSNSVINVDVKVAKEQPSSSLPLIDDYSTIGDILEASSTFVKQPSSRDIPGYEVIDITQLKSKDSKTLLEDSSKEVAATLESATNEIHFYSSVEGENGMMAENESEKKASHKEEGDRGLVNEEDNDNMPQYSEVRGRVEDTSSGRKDEGCDEVQYSEVGQDFSNSKSGKDNNGISDDLKVRSELDAAIQDMPLYSTVNLELKKSREALDDHKRSEEKRASDHISFDDVLNDITKLADELPVISSSPPPAIPPQLDLFTSPSN